MEQKNQYWKGIEEAEKHPEFLQTQGNEFYEAFSFRGCFKFYDIMIYFF